MSELISQYEATKSHYAVLGVDSNRMGTLMTIPLDQFDGEVSIKEIAVGAGLIVNFLKREIPPQMLSVILTLLFKEGNKLADAMILELQETAKLQREVIKGLMPPESVIELVEREIGWLEEREERIPLINWLYAVRGEISGETQGDDGGSEEMVGEGTEETTTDP